MLSFSFVLALAHPALALAEGPIVRELVKTYLAAEKYPAVSKTVKAWERLPKGDQLRLAELLVPSLTDCGRVSLKDPEDMIILYRLETGDLQYQGHGFAVKQDLFTVGGRAAWAIEKLLGDEMPELNGGLTGDEWARRAADIAKRVKEAVELFVPAPDAPAVKAKPPEKAADKK
ncbi:MAG: hypothetical protein MUF18_00240 [Fimbriiglobus sp.]|jgi:hypothetical protein|nr:hypothetical protein [Fimbriiglobus sp.]